MSKIGKRIINKPVRHIPDSSDILSQLQVIYASTIAQLSAAAKTDSGLTSRQIKDFSTLIKSFATINAEIRECRQQSLLEGMSIDEQLRLVKEALKALNKDTNIIDVESQDEEDE